MAFAFFRTSCKNKTIIFQIARMNYNKFFFFLKNNLNGKVHTSQEGSSRVWQNWAHFSLLMSYFSDNVVNTVLIGCKGPFPRGHILGSMLSSGSRLCTTSSSEVKLLSLHPYLAVTLTRLNIPDNKVKEFLHPVYKGFVESLYNPSYTGVCAC